MSLVATFISCVFLFAGQSPPDTIRQHYEKAEAARAAGNLSTAETEYTAILGEGYERLGAVYLALEDYQHAIPALQAAVGYRANAPATLIELAIAYYGSEQYARALEPADQASKLDPDNVGAHQMLGKTYFMLGDLGRSITELEIAAKLSPNDVDVSYTLGVAYLRNRQPEVAKKLYQSMIQVFGDRPQLHVVIGRAYRQSGLLKDAAAEFKKAIALDPHFPRAHYYLGITYLLDEGQSQMDQALAEFQVELAANPDEFFANYYRGVVYIFQRKWDLAVPPLQKAAAIQPDNPDPYFQLGQAYQELNQHEQAIEVLKKAIAFNPDLGHNKGQVSTAHHRLAQSLLKTGHVEAGQRELQIASDLKAQVFKLEQQSQSSGSGMGAAKLPETKDLLDPALAHGVAATGDVDDGTKQKLRGSDVYFKKVVAAAHNNVGLLRAERQDFRGAVEHFALAAKWDPRLEGVDYNLGLAYYKSGLYKEATAPLEAELKEHPANRPARLILGMSWFMLGKALLERGERVQGIENLERAVQLDPDQPEFHGQLGQAYLTAGRRAEGEREIEIAKQLKSKIRDPKAPQ